MGRCCGGTGGATRRSSRSVDGRLSMRLAILGGSFRGSSDGIVTCSCVGRVLEALASLPRRLVPLNGGMAETVNFVELPLLLCLPLDGFDTSLAKLPARLRLVAFLREPRAYWDRSMVRMSGFCGSPRLSRGSIAGSCVAGGGEGMRASDDGAFCKGND